MTFPTVIIPVHNAYAHVARCLETVAESVPAGTRVLLIDDASTDTRILPLLQHWVKQPGPDWRLELVEKNAGFVASVNLGMRRTTADVVLLNSDTEVTRGWLDGLSRCLTSHPRIATATPWTNNGEIASLPGFCIANPVPPDPEQVAAVIAGAGPAAYPDIPTAVGFCMAISRRAIDTLGLFDEQTFGRGYGEENDFCMRASNAGMRNVLCDDVYVVHHGGQSFGPLGLKPDAASMQRLLSLHPDFLKQVQTFIARDPLEPRRRALVDRLQRAGAALR